MLNTTEHRESCSLEVALIPESKLCGNVGFIQKAEFAQGCSLLCCLDSQGGLRLGDIAETEASGDKLDDTYSDFLWEEVTVHNGSCNSSRLLAVGSQCQLKLVELEAEGSTSNACLAELSARCLLQQANDKDLSVSELGSLKLLSFIDGRCCLLLNSSSLIHLLWEHGSVKPHILSCCHIQLSPEAQKTCADYQLCRGTLFVLTTSGIIYVLDSVEGRQVASVDLPSYLKVGLEEEEEEDLVPGLSSFCLIQVSPDLSTAIAATQANTAVAVDLNHYFRSHPEHLLCHAVPSRRPLKPQEPSDQDSLSCSAYSHTVLGTSFLTDQSWEARLTSMYNKAKAPLPSPSPPKPGRLPWFQDLPNIDQPQATSAAKVSQSRVPARGSAMVFSLPDTAAPALLSICEFSAVVTFTSPGNCETAVAFWDLQSQIVTYHRSTAVAMPVQRCAEKQLSLLLKTSGLYLVLFALSQEELLNRLMMFGSAATVDSLCHLNAWGRCSIPLHALKAGLKNRQLDTVDFFLKSKANLLFSSNGVTEQLNVVSTEIQLKNVQDLCPSLDLLCSAIKDTHTEGQSRQFSEQLLNITLAFLNTQVRTVLSETPELDGHLLQCVEILDGYITNLRSFMKRFPWHPASDPSTTGTSASPLALAEMEKEWNLLTTDKVVQQAVLTNQIPRAQAYFRGRGRPEQRLKELCIVGLRLAFTCLGQSDLQLASALLRNMGFNVKKQLHSICLYTDNPKLRDFLVEELSNKSYLSDEEAQRVAFMKDMEGLGAVSSIRCGQPVARTRLLQMVQMDPVCQSRVEELIHGESRSDPGLWTSLRLDWVRHWDLSAQRTILLSRLNDSGLSSCEPVVLWCYLTSLHDQSRVDQWIQSLAGRNGDPADAPQWPALTADIVNDNTLCSAYMKDCILHLLARRGMYTHDEMGDFEQLLWRLGQAGGVMQASPSVPQYRSPQGYDFHTRFIHHCLGNTLRYLLYTYLEHHRLTPRNCSALADTNLYESYPWFEMLVKMQDITRDLLDPERVFQASLTSAQVLLPGSQASVSSMLLEGHSLLALATIMFAPGGIDQVVSQGEKAGGSVWRVDPQLLRMALSPYPKLRAALFPPSGTRAGSSATNGNADISAYHLMQSLHPLDTSKLFGWQSANPLGFTDTSSDLPHFSSPHLVHKYALVENLDFLYYLRHGRPSFAYGTFLVQQLAGSSDVKLQLSHAAKQAHGLAMKHFSTASVAAACVCFYELLGLCSLKLRVDLKALRLVLRHWSLVSGESSAAQHEYSLALKGTRLLEAEQQSAEELLLPLEAAVKDVLEHKAISRSSYEAGQEWALPVQFCRLHCLPLSAVYPRDCAAEGQWLHFLLFVQLHGYPPPQVRSLAAQFGPALQAHVTLAFQDLQAQWGGSQSGRAPCLVEAPGSNPEAPGGPRELFQVLLQSQEQTSPWRHLLAEAVGQHCPTMTVLAACHQEADLLQCLCVWVLTSVDRATAQQAVAHLDENPRHHEWSLHDLSIIWKTLLREAKIRPLIRGFQLFQKDSPLIHVLLMYELCYDYKNFPEAKKKLLDFQKCLINLRSSGGPVSAGLPLQWVECQASALLLAMVQQCSTRYELRRLLQLLADMDRLLKSNGPDFKKLSQLSQVLQDSSVCLSPGLLESYSPDGLQEECQSILQQLQAAGRFSQARQVAHLAGLPIDGLVVNELLRDLGHQKAKRHWERRETRVAFWRKCHHQFRANQTRPEAVGQFFLSQASAGLPPGCVAETELLCVQERCLLLGLAGHWLSLLGSAGLADLEKQLWAGRLRQQVLLTALEKESIFALQAPAAAPEENSYEALVKEFSFSKMAALNEPRYLSLEGLPSSTGEGGAGESALGVEEQAALGALVGELLDEGCIHEASRVCRYFSFCCRDLGVVLLCRGLAAGEITAGLHDVTSEALPKTSFPGPSSFPSLSSFVMVPSPEDQVVTQLQTLVASCQHGKSYCKQVLSLYELSKELQCPYTEISAEEPQGVLCKVLLSQQPDRYKKAQAFISVQGLEPPIVAQLVSSAVVRGLLAAAQEGEPAEKQIYSPSDGREAFLQLARLCGDANLVGIQLLDLMPTVPLSDLGCTVELLVLAHDCFSLTCNMEGIVRVLQASRHLSHTHLAHSERYSLLVRLLTGIGRYNDMIYIFDLLNQNHRFEMLLRKKVESNSSLKTALLDYIKRCLPGDSEKYNMVALCFSMCREIGENHEGAARTQLKLIESQPWALTSELQTALIKVLTLLKDAAESYSKDSCLRQATRCVKMAKLVTLQLHFLAQGKDQRVINLRPSELLSTMVALPRCYQAFVVSEAFAYSPDWAEVLYQKVLLNGDFAYLEEFRLHRPLPSSLFEDISQKLTHNKPPGSASQNMKRLLQHCEDVYTYYRLAYQHKFYDVANMLLQDSKTSSYLSDRLGS
ncbi:spatacsin [Aplochiton taeniatus]